MMHDAVDADGIQWIPACVMQGIPWNPVDPVMHDAVDPDGIQWIPPVRYALDSDGIQWIPCA